MDLDINSVVSREVGTKSNVFRFTDGALLRDDNAFLYTGDSASSVAYTICSSQTPDAYMRGILTNELGPWQYFKPTISESDLVTAGLQYWAAKVKQWRSACKTRQEARTREYFKMAAQGDLMRIDLDTGEQHPVGPDDHAEDPLMRKVRIGKPGHVCTAVCYARWDQEKGLIYEVIFTWACHEQCGESVDSNEVIRLAMRHEAEDTARAKAVVAEW